MEDDRSLRWLYLDLNSYFASVQQQLHPHLRGKAIAIGPEKVDSGTIIAASYEAKAYGVRTGLRVAEARRLCPQLIIVGDGHAVYSDYHERIVAEVWRHIPVTHICSVDEVACRLLDNENSPEQAIALARRIKAGIARRVGACLTSSIGIAPSRLVAKMAADMQKPDGLTVITRSMLPHALYPLPLSDVPGIGRRMEARLNARGITTMRQLLEPGRSRAGSAWGSVLGMRLWHGLHGEDIAERPQQSRSIGHSHVLAPQVRDPETARQTARRLLLKAATRLRRAECVTKNLTLAVRFESGRFESGRFESAGPLSTGPLSTGPLSTGRESGSGWHASTRFEPTDDSFPLLDALTTLWQRLAAATTPQTRIRLVAVTLNDIRPATGTQLNLFHPHRTRSRALAVAIDQINQRHGRTTTIGHLPNPRTALIGTKIAFTRVPDRREFQD